MSELPTATASGGAAEPLPTDVIVAVRPRRVGIVTGVLAGLYLFALAVAYPIPNRLVALLGGPGDDFGRYGGVQMIWRPPHDFDTHGLEERFAAREHGASLVALGGRFEVDVPHVAEADMARTIQRIAGEGRLEFHEVVQAPEMRRLAGVLGLSMHGKTPVDLQVDEWRGEGAIESQTDYFLVGPTRGSLEDKLVEAGKLGWRLPDGVHIAFEHLSPLRKQGDGWRTYVLSNVVALDGQSIENATGTFDPNTNRPIVLVEFDRDGAARFGQLTGRITGKKLAIVLDGEIRSAPVINGRIAGGRASITMGGADSAQMESDRDSLVTALRAGALPPGGDVVASQFVPAAQLGTKLWLARILGSLAGAIAIGGLAALGVRALRPHRRRVVALTGAASRWPRILWTLGGVALFLFGTQIVLPGINEAEFDFVVSRASWHDLSNVSIFALGVSPLISAFVMVEVIASLVPRWRRLRDGGPEARRKLGRVIAIVALVFAALQGYFVATYLQALTRGGAEVIATTAGARWMIVVSLVTATAVLAWLASMIGHRGIGNGYAVLLLASLLLRVPWTSLDTVPVAHLVLGVATAALIALIILVVTGWRVGGVGAVAIPLPAAGLAPLGDAGGLGTLIASLTAMGVGVPADWLFGLHGTLTALLVVIVATFAWSFAFARPGRRRVELARLGLAPADRAGWLRAAVASAGVLVALFALGHFGRALPGLAEPLGVIVAIVTIADLANELRDRRAGLIPIWPLHDPLLVDAVRDRLTAAAIPHHLQAARLRSLLWLFGSYVPIMVLVPPDRAVEAERSLRDWLAPESG